MRDGYAGGNGGESCAVPVRVLFAATRGFGATLFEPHGDNSLHRHSSLRTPNMSRLLPHRWFLLSLLTLVVGSWITSPIASGETLIAKRSCVQRCPELTAPCAAFRVGEQD